MAVRTYLPASSTLRLIPPFQQGAAVADGIRSVFAEELGLVSGTKATWAINGPTALTFNVAAPTDRAIQALSEGWRCELLAGGRVVWGGRVDQVVPGQPWTVTVSGLAAPDGDVDLAGVTATASQVTAAYTRGVWPVKLVGTAPNVPASAPAAPNLAGLLSTAANTAGQVWSVAPNPQVPGEGLLTFTAVPAAALPVGMLEATRTPDQVGSGAPNSVQIVFLNSSSSGAQTIVRQVAAASTFARRGTVEKRLDLTQLGQMTQATAIALGQRWLLGASSATASALSVAPGGLLWFDDRASAGAPGGARPALGRVAQYLPGRLLVLTGTGGGSGGSSLITQDRPTIQQVVWDCDADTLALTPIGSTDASFLGRVAAGTGKTYGLQL